MRMDKESLFNTQTEKGKRQRLEKYEGSLKRFEFRQSLLQCISHNFSQPNVVEALLQELLRRNSLPLALTFLSPQECVLVLRFLNRWARSARYSTTILPFARLIISNHFLLLFPELYGGTLGVNPEVDKEFTILKQSLDKEIEVQKKLIQIKAKIVTNRYSNSKDTLSNVASLSK